MQLAGVGLHLDDIAWVACIVGLDFRHKWRSGHIADEQLVGTESLGGFDNQIQTRRLANAQNMFRADSNGHLFETAFPQALDYARRGLQQTTTLESQRKNRAFLRQL